MISQHPRRAQPHAIDEEMYKWRHLIENFFCKLKEFKRIAMLEGVDQVPSMEARASPIRTESNVLPDAGVI